MSKAKRPKQRVLKPHSVIHSSYKHVLTNEDWYPTVDGKLRVGLVGWHDGKWMVTVCGGDDTRLEKHIGSESEAREEFDRVSDLNTRAELRSRGFN